MELKETTFNGHVRKRDREEGEYQPFCSKIKSKKVQVSCVNVVKDAEYSET